MENLYFDEIHKGGRDTKSMLIKCGIISLGLILALVFLLLTFATPYGQITFLLSIGSIAGMVYLLKYRSKEYEYIFTNGEVDVDVISGRMTRKRLCTIKAEVIDNIAKYSLEEYKKATANAPKVLDVSSGIKEECYIITAHINHTKTVLIMSPSERLLDAWKPYLKKLDYMMRFNNM